MDWKGVKGTIMTDIPMKRYTSMKVGGSARFLVYPSDEEDLITILNRLNSEGIKSRFMGNGTNIIVHDKGLDEALIRTTEMKHMRYLKAGDGVMAEVSGGLSLTQFIQENTKRGLSGLEKLFGIPGTVGGAVKMNAGSFGSVVSDTLKEVRLVDRTDVKESTADTGDGFGYRNSPIKSSQCVLGARFFLTAKDRAEIIKDMDYVYEERRRKHPMEYPSSGSVFKSVEGEPAWKFIEQAGLKGVRAGDAQVSEKHANFIINLGNATAADIKTLIDKVKIEVYEKQGVSLEEEVELWGFDG
ncbi:MAG: UDP-N-acetylmuramate dehydrogenase [Syntrophobacterales bacterium]|jgi:UDP-N-acetylmuramate dehydrogenase|nr:UDP-N-acetylmuramate dehydrogenase [Syntrophobacterales bacterium]